MVEKPSASASSVGRAQQATTTKDSPSLFPPTWFSPDSLAFSPNGPFPFLSSDIAFALKLRASEILWGDRGVDAEPEKALISSSISESN